MSISTLLSLWKYDIFSEFKWYILNFALISETALFKWKGDELQRIGFGMVTLQIKEPWHSLVVEFLCGHHCPYLFSEIFSIQLRDTQFFSLNNLL